MSLGQWEEAGGRVQPVTHGCHADLSTGSFHFKSTARMFSSLSVNFHLKLLKENILLSYIFALENIHWAWNSLETHLKMHMAAILDLLIAILPYNA